MTIIFKIRTNTKIEIKDKSLKKTNYFIELPNMMASSLVVVLLAMMMRSSFDSEVKVKKNPKSKEERIKKVNCLDR